MDATAVAALQALHDRLARKVAALREAKHALTLEVCASRLRGCGSDAGQSTPRSPRSPRVSHMLTVTRAGAGTESPMAISPLATPLPSPHTAVSAAVSLSDDTALSGSSAAPVIMRREREVMRLEKELKVTGSRHRYHHGFESDCKG
jgi:hypothetical protein